MRAIVLENRLLSTTVLLDQGADIHTLVYKPKDVDVLWKPPRPPREPGVGPNPEGDSETIWHNYYRGGWQVILPNFGPEVSYGGAPLDFHGEAARTSWTLDALNTTETGAEATMSVTLIKSPLRVRRTMSVDAERPVLSVTETVINDGVVETDCMWGHHPAYGPPLLSPDTVIDTGARSVESDDGSEVPSTDLALGETWEWPNARDREGNAADMSRIPAPGSGLSRVLYLEDFAEGWYALTNLELGLGVGVVWGRSPLPVRLLLAGDGGASWATRSSEGPMSRPSSPSAATLESGSRGSSKRPARSSLWHRARAAPSRYARYSTRVASVWRASTSLGMCRGR